MSEMNQLRTVPPKYAGIYRRALTGSRTAAIKCMCLECQGWEDGAVKAVKLCGDKGCPLYTVRGYKPGDPTPLENEEGEQGDIQAKKAAELKARRIEIMAKAREVQAAKKAKVDP